MGGRCRVFNSSIEFRNLISEKVHALTFDSFLFPFEKSSLSLPTFPKRRCIVGVLALNAARFFVVRWRGKEGTESG